MSRRRIIYSFYIAPLTSPTRRGLRVRSGQSWNNDYILIQSSLHRHPDSLQTSLVLKQGSLPSFACMFRMISFFERVTRASTPHFFAIVLISCIFMIAFSSLKPSVPNRVPDNGGGADGLGVLSHHRQIFRVRQLCMNPGKDPPFSPYPSISNAWAL
jgi:hypothetical protein